MGAAPLDDQRYGFIRRGGDHASIVCRISLSSNHAFVLIGPAVRTGMLQVSGAPAIDEPMAQAIVWRMWCAERTDTDLLLAGGVMGGALRSLRRSLAAASLCDHNAPTHERLAAHLAELSDERVNGARLVAEGGRPAVAGAPWAEPALGPAAEHRARSAGNHWAQLPVLDGRGAGCGTAQQVVRYRRCLKSDTHPKR